MLDKDLNDIRETFTKGIVMMMTSALEILDVA